MFLEAVKQNGLALQFVKKTPEIWLAAMRENGVAYRYVYESTPEILLEAVKYNPDELEYMGEYQTLEICLAAVKHDGLAIRHVWKSRFKKRTLNKYV